jgi:hypothetical protein
MTDRQINEFIVMCASGWTRGKSSEVVVQYVMALIDAIGPEIFETREFALSTKNRGVIRSDRYGIDIIPVPDGEHWSIHQSWSQPWERRRVMVEDFNSIEWSKPDDLRGEIETMATAVEDYLAANPKPASLLDRLRGFFG